MIRRHNEIRDVTASLLGEVTQNVKIKLHYSHSQEKYYEAGVRAWKMQPEWM